ncbi:MAG: cellulase family glycosylhydrolase [Prolixibacteraceae bacterium]|jgi:endoglucanase|nr:cellulase family glycosylhydrolase [Prolixibacteraceae bacterium]
MPAGEKCFTIRGEEYHSTTNPNRNVTWGEESMLDNLLRSMNEQFVSKGIPVILGKFAVIRRSNLTGEDLELHLASRAHFLKHLIQQSKANGLLPFYWDAGNMGNNSSALFNRYNNTVYNQQALDALMEGITE